MNSRIAFFLLLYVTCQIFFVNSCIANTLRGDINENGKVEIFDLLELLSYIKIGQAPDRTTQHIANVDKTAGDKIDIFDLLAMLKIISGKSQPEPITWRIDISGPVEGTASPEDTLTFLLETFGGRAPIPQLKVIQSYERQVHLLGIVQQDSSQIRIKLPWTFQGEAVYFIENEDTLFTWDIDLGRIDLRLAKMEASLRRCFQDQLADYLRSYLHFELYSQTITTRFDSVLNDNVTDTIPKVTVADSLKLAFEDFFELFADRKVFKPGDTFPNTWDFDVIHKGIKYFFESDSASLHISIGSQLLPGDSVFLKSLTPEQLSRFDEQERGEMLNFCLIEIPLTFKYSTLNISSVESLLAILRTKEFWQGRMAIESNQN